jgi:hypothetical protein
LQVQNGYVSFGSKIDIHLYSMWLASSEVSTGRTGPAFLCVPGNTKELN